MSKKRSPESRKRDIRPFLFENGDIVVLDGDMKIGSVSRYRVIGREHANTHAKSIRSSNVYSVENLVSGETYQVNENNLTRTVADALMTKTARSLGHQKAQILAEL